MNFSNNNIKSIDDFVNQDSLPKSSLQKCIKYLIRETNKNKFDYNQLRYIFRNVREQCDIDVIKPKNTLYQLPTPTQIKSFYSVISNPAHKLIFQFLQHTGLRVSELCNLKVAKINFQENTLFIEQGKGNKDRIVPFGNSLKEKVLLYLESRNNKYLFESIRNSKFSTRRIEQVCSKYLSESRLDLKITPHTFRHIYFSYLASNKVSKEHRMLIAGHRNGKTQDIYTHLSLDGIKDEIIEILDKS